MSLLDLSSISPEATQVALTDHEITVVEVAIEAIRTLISKRGPMTHLKRNGIATVIAVCQSQPMVWLNEIDDDPSQYLMVGSIGFSENELLHPIFTQLNQYLEKERARAR